LAGSVEGFSSELEICLLLPLVLLVARCMGNWDISIGWEEIWQRNSFIIKFWRIYDQGLGSRWLSIWLSIWIHGVDEEVYTLVLITGLFFWYDVGHMEFRERSIACIAS